MARPPHPESSPRGPLIAAILAALILSFLPQRALSWLNGPSRLVRYLLYPVSDPVRAIAARLRPAAPRLDDAQTAHLKDEIEKFKELYYKALAIIDDKQRLIESLQQGAAIAEGPIRPLNASVIAISSSGVGGVIQVRAGSKIGVERSTIASTSGVQLVGRVSEVGPRTCSVTLMTDKASGPIDGVILGEEGARLAQIRNLSPQRGQRLLAGQVLYTSPPSPDPKVGDVVRVDDKSWPRAAQRLVIGQVVDVQKGVAGRILVTVKPTVELERLGEVMLLMSPSSEQRDGGGGAP